MSENIIIEKIVIRSIVSNIILGDGGIKIICDREIQINDKHEQECCESVYADFPQTTPYLKEIIGKKIENLIIKKVEGEGILLCFDQIKVFVPCYDEQNGYYSSNLSLVVADNEVKKIIDITGATEYIEN